MIDDRSHLFIYFHMKRFVVFDLYLIEYFITVYAICTKLRSSSIEMNLIIHCAKFF